MTIWHESFDNLAGGVSTKAPESGAGGCRMTGLGTPQRLLIVDDDRANLESLVRIFEREKIEVLTAPDGKAALDLLRRERVSICLTDLMMPGMSGLELLRAAKTVSAETEFILMTAFGTVETAVEAMKEGAWDFVTKPFKRIQIVRAVKRAMDQQSLVLENHMLRAQLQETRRHRAIVGGSLPIRHTLAMVQQVAPSSATVLLLGESGTGKELFARAIHESSHRATRAFIVLNCAALPETLLETELFGHEKGAFTGASSRREGRFELADGGTLFLDEVAETSPQVQVKLLRVLQEGEFERVGGSRTLRVDVRIVCATNKDLAAEVAAGRFREDLFYRLNVISITLPPLRSRKDDVPLLAHHFLKLYADKNSKRVTGISREAMEAMLTWDWPGNVRELENEVQRLVIQVEPNAFITPDFLSPRVRQMEGLVAQAGKVKGSLKEMVEQVEKYFILETLREHGNNKTSSAKTLGITREGLHKKLKQLGIG